VNLCTDQIGNKVKIASYRWNNYIHRGVEQPNWGRVVPFLVLGRELSSSDMPEDRSHGDLTLAPRAAEVIIKNVVLDVFFRGVVLYIT